MTTPSVAPRHFRIACVQHGDYLVARRRLDAGGSETYGSQRYSVNAQERLLAGHQHLVISLDGPRSDETDGLGRYVCAPDTMPQWLPARIRLALRARRLVRLVKDFAPTHLLLRTNDLLGCAMLKLAQQQNVMTAVMVAARFDPDHGPARAFCALANQDNVLFVGNHNLVATRSLLTCGLRKNKAIAWDFPMRISPDDAPPKTTGGGRTLPILFAGNLIENKGASDVLEGVRLGRKRGLDLHLTICGDGPLRAMLAADPAVQEGWLTVAGPVAIEDLWAHMRASWVVVMATRPAFPEALPLTLIDALATRTPVLVSDHPIFREFFKQDQGLAFFRAADPPSLAETIVELAADPARYAALSEQTAGVWQDLQIDETFEGLLTRFAQSSGLRTPCTNVPDGQLQPRLSPVSTGL